MVYLCDGVHECDSVMVCVCRLLLKVCKTLKNHSRDVRAVAGDTLLKMAHSLGPRYLQLTVKELKES